MPVITKQLLISEEILEGIKTGLYTLSGSVVRYATGPNGGNIVTHLKEAGLLKLLKIKWFKYVVVGTALVGGAYYIYNLGVKKGKIDKEKQIKDYFFEYANNLKNNIVDTTIVQKLLDYLNKNSKEDIEKEIPVELINKEIENINRYTNEINVVGQSNGEILLLPNHDNPLENLKENLLKQKIILKI